jgi:hypothetical protein
MLKIRRNLTVAREPKIAPPTPREFGSIATSLARNPLGIIALFIVLVYDLLHL